MSVSVTKYTSKPAPLANSEGRLDGSWIVVDEAGRVRARFQYDGRDKAEAWIHAHTLPRCVVCGDFLQHGCNTAVCSMVCEAVANAEGLQ